MAAKRHMTVTFSDYGQETERIRFHLGSLYEETFLKLDPLSFLTLITKLQSHWVFGGCSAFCKIPLLIKNCPSLFVE